jgi:hypothetical protein
MHESGHTAVTAPCIVKSKPSRQTYTSIPFAPAATVIRSMENFQFWSRRDISARENLRLKERKTDFEAHTP